MQPPGPFARLRALLGCDDEQRPRPISQSRVSGSSTGSTFLRRLTAGTIPETQRIGNATNV